MSAHSSSRSQAKLIVSLLPGLHLRRLQRLLGVSFSTTRYHVEWLERQGEILRFKEGGHDRLYPAGTNDEMRAVYAVLQSKNARRVLRALERAGGDGLTNGELSERLRVPRSTLSECVEQLSDVQLVRRSLSLDGRVLYGVSRREDVSRLMALLDRNVVAAAAEGFIDLWDF